MYPLLLLGHHLLSKWDFELSERNLEADAEISQKQQAYLKKLTLLSLLFYKLHSVFEHIRANALVFEFSIIMMKLRTSW